MSLALFEPIRILSDVRCHAGADMLLLRKLEECYGIAFPEDHLQALHESNGVEAYGGYIRLFGVETDDSINIIRWNSNEYWKFAWNDRCSKYWCFAETAWGDQYAYHVEELRKGVPRVYFLECISMAPEPIASSFSEFMEKEFIRIAKNPYDSMMRAARGKFGELEVGTHLIHIPSVLLGGQDDIEHVQTMNARSAMICNGDIAIQLEAGPPDRVVNNVIPYEDEAHRSRLRLVWS
jgi:hypothetical protein